MSDNINQAVRDVVKGASVIYLGLILQMGIAFFAQVLAARFLTTGGFGGITMGTALLNVGSIVGSLGLAEGLIRYLPRIEREKWGRVVVTTLLISLAVSILLAALVVVNAEFIAVNIFDDPTVEINIRIFGAGIPFATLLFVAIGGIRGRKKARFRVYVENIAHPSLRFLLVGAAIVFGLGQAGFASAYVLPYVVTALLATYFLLGTVSDVDKPSLDVQSLPTGMIRYSIPFVITSMTGFLFRSVDIFLLLYFYDSGAVGIYGVAYASARLMLLFSSALNFLGAPVASELEASDGMGAVFDVHFRVVRWVSILSIPTLVPLVIFASDFIELIYRPRYVPGSTALAVLALGFAVHNLFSVQSNLFRANGSSKELAAVNATAAIFNVALNLYLIPEHGLLGAAVATVLSYFARDFLMFSFIYYEFGEAPITTRVVPPIALALPLLAILVYLKPLFSTAYTTLLGVSGAFAGVYVALVITILGLDSKEVMLLRSAEERVGIESQIVDWIVKRFS